MSLFGAATHAPSSRVGPLATRPRTCAAVAVSEGVLRVPHRSLVVVAGLPGAGKTTLLRRLHRRSRDAVQALDAEQVAEVLMAQQTFMSYRVIRPLVHGAHLVRVIAALQGPAACVLATDPMTSPVRRILLSFAARPSGRTVHLVLIDATPAEAQRGQWLRGRVLPPRRMARHVARLRKLKSQVALSRRMPGSASTLVVTRSTAATITNIEVAEAR